MAHKTFLLTIAFLLPLACFAHGGHGHFHGWELAHFLTSPLHVVPMLLAVGAGALIYFHKKKAKRIEP